MALARSVEIFLEMGMERVERHLHALHEPVIRWMAGRPDVTPVTPFDPGKRAGILSFRHPDTEAAVTALQEAKVVFGVREGAIRFAPHYSTSRTQMEAVVGILEDVG